MKFTAKSILYSPFRAGVKLLVRLNPFYRGGARVATLSCLNRLTPTGTLVLVHLRRGPRCLVRVDEWGGRIIYYTGDYDRRITWICRQLLRPGDCFLDIGANFGEVGLYAAQFVGPTGLVHMFEPQPKLANLIRVSAELNNFKHVSIHEVALSDRDGQSEFLVPRTHTGMGSLSADRPPNCEVDVLKVQVRKSGAYLEQLNLPPIRAIKIDVEGHEEQVIARAMDLLRSNKPAAIVFESHNNGQSFFERGGVKLISSLGYEFFQLYQKIWLRVQLKKLESNDSLENGWDFVALSMDPQHRDVYELLGID